MSEEREPENRASHPELRTIVFLIFGSFLLSAIITLTVGKAVRHLQLVIGELVLILPTLWYLQKKKFDFVVCFRVSPISRRVIAAAAVLSIAIPVLSDELDRIVSTFVAVPPEFETLIAETMRAETAGDWLALILGAVIFAGFFEEMLFRGVLQKALEARFELPLALSMSALIFALVHPSVWMLQVFVTGCLYSYLAWRSQSILPGIVLHLINNLFALFYLNLDIGNWEWYEWYGHVNPPVVAVAACIAFYAIGWFNRQYPLDSDLDA